MVGGVEGQAPLQPAPGEAAPKRLRDENKGLGGRGKQGKGGGQQRGAGKEEQGRGRWSMPGFSADPGSAVMVAGSYVVRAVQTSTNTGGAAGSSWERDMAGSRSSQGKSKHHRLGAEW